MTDPWYVPQVPDESWNDPVVGAVMHTGTHALDAAWEFPGGTVAVDIETPGLDEPMTIRCITAAWYVGERVHTVLLDPQRRHDHHAAARVIIDRADELVLHNCFAGDTSVITREGVRRFEDMSGETVEVWTERGWREAEARCYGDAPVREVHLKPARYRSNVAHTLRATGNHRWPLVDGRLVTTDELKPGDKIMAERPRTDVILDSAAFRHGLIFADGALQSHQPVSGTEWAFQMRLCGDKAKWVHLFDRVTYPPSANGDPVVTGRLPFNPKELPVSPDADYAAAFIEGWQLLDGASRPNGGRTVSTVDPDAARWLREHAALGGWYATGHERKVQSGGYRPGAVIYTVALSKNNAAKPVEWRVDGIGPPSDPIPVYCVEVPGTERFTLAQGVYTGNSSFDIPGLYHHDLVTRADVHKVTDTLIAARMASPDPYVPKSLGALAERFLALEDAASGMKLAFKAAGFKTQDEGYRLMDIDRPIYRVGAMADTVATLRVLPCLRDAVVERLTVQPFESLGIRTRDGALARLHQEQRVNRIMLWRSARGLAVDLDYLHAYREQVAADVTRAEVELTQAGLRPGVGSDLVAALDSLGALPSTWPRTATGKLSSAKGHLKNIVHPLADAHRTVAETEKVLGYLDAVAQRSQVTGRVHPQCGVLAASATGRMSYAAPALQQFSAQARGIICSDTAEGFSSVDYSQIEPVVLANLSGDVEFLAPFEAGADLYEPIQRAAGIDRKTAKVVLLATLYGQGTTRLAETIGQSPEGALQIKRQMLSAMPGVSAKMNQIQQVAEQTCKAITISGRILPVPVFNGEVAAHKATNYTIQGSAYDVLSDTLVRLDDAGLSDHVYLAMHDELVVDTPVAQDVQAVMDTPPEDLVRVSGRTPVLRTDREHMGTHWRSV